MTERPVPLDRAKSADSLNGGFPRVPAFLADSRAFTLIQGLAETAGISSRPVSPNPQHIEPSADDEGPEDEGGGQGRQHQLSGGGGAGRRGNRGGGNAKGVANKRRPSGSPTQHRRWSSHGSPALNVLPMSTRIGSSAGGSGVKGGAASPQQQRGDGAATPKFSRKHIEQAVRLASEALDEDRKGKGGDADYAVDCYFSSLDYLLSALPPSSSADLLSGNPGRRALLQNKLTKLVEKLGGPLSPSASSSGAGFNFPSSAEGDPVPAGGSDKWWLVPVPARLRRRTTSAPARDNFALTERKKGAGKGELVAAGDTVSGAIQPPTDLVAACSCGRKVTIQLPQWVLDSARTDAGGNEKDQLPKTWAEALIAASVGIAVLIKRSPIPYLLSALLGSVLSMVLFLDARFQLRTRTIMFLGDALEALVELDKALGLHQAAGEAASVIWEAGIRAAVAFARADGFRPSSSHANPQPYGPISTGNEMELHGSGAWDAIPTNVNSSSSTAPAQRRIFGSRGAQGLSPTPTGSGSSAPITGGGGGAIRRGGSSLPPPSAASFSRRGGTPRASFGYTDSRNTPTPTTTSSETSRATTPAGSSSGDPSKSAAAGYSVGGVDAPPSYGAAIEQGEEQTPRSSTSNSRSAGWARTAAGSVAGRLGFPGAGGGE